MNIPNSKTIEDLERAAWLAGDRATASALASLIDNNPEALQDQVEELNNEIGALKDRVEELEPYESCADHLIQIWQDGMADGHWPCKSVTDDYFLSIVYSDMERAGDALNLVRDLARLKSGIANGDADDMLSDFVDRAERILAD